MGHMPYESFINLSTPGGNVGAGSSLRPSRVYEEIHTSAIIGLHSCPAAADLGGCFAHL